LIVYKLILRNWMGMTSFYWKKYQQCFVDTYEYNPYTVEAQKLQCGLVKSQVLYSIVKSLILK